LAKTAKHLRITGIVHGVFFRASMAEVAANNGVTGWVRNKTDGTVEAFLEGDEDSVGRVVQWARKGPPRARVDSVRVHELNPRNTRGFKIEG
jgi:acylphosphatase